MTSDRNFLPEPTLIVGIDRRNASRLLACVVHGCDARNVWQTAGHFRQFWCFWRTLQTEIAGVNVTGVILHLA